MRITLLCLVLCFGACLASCRDGTDDIVDAVRARDFDALMAMRADPDQAIACKAAKTVAWARGPELAQHHQTLLSFTRCDWELRAEAAWRLSEELDAKSVVAVLPELARQLEDPDEKIRWNVARVIGLVGAPEGLPIVTGCLKDENPFVAAWCAWSKCKLEKGPSCKRPNMDLTNGKPAP